jgi:hypothetical protein
LQIDAYANIYDIAKLLGSIQQVENLTINNYGNMNAQFGNNNNINNGANLNINQREEAENIASKFIDENPPVSGVNSADYFEYYKNHVKELNLKSLSIQAFSKLVENAGFKKVSTGKKWCWKI